MLTPTFFLGLLLSGTELPKDEPVCWIDPMTGRPYLAKCDKAKKPPRPPVVEKTKETREPAPKAEV